MTTRKHCLNFKICGGLVGLKGTVCQWCYMRNWKKRRQLSAYVTPEIHKAVSAKVARAGVSRSSYLRNLIEEDLNEHTG